MYSYDLIPVQDVITKTDWKLLLETLASRLTLGKVGTLVIEFNKNITSYSLYLLNPLHEDLGSIGVFTLKPSNKLPSEMLPSKRKFIVSFATGKNIHNLAENYRLKEDQSLVKATIDIHKNISQLSAHLKLFFYKKNQIFLYKKSFASFPYHLLEADYASSSSVNIATPPNYLGIEKALSLMNSNKYNSLFEVNGYPYFQRNYYIPLTNFDFDRHGLIVGQSGSGKSKFIELLLMRLHSLPNADNYRVILIDPHGSIEKNLKNFDDKTVLNFRTSSTKLFSSSGDINTATELSFSMIMELMGNVKNSRIERLLRYSLYVLFSRGEMSFMSLKHILSDNEYRKEVIESVRLTAPESVLMFFDTDFSEFKTKFYLETFEPLMSLIDELSLIKGISSEGDESLAVTINKKFLTVVSLSKSSMGERAVRTIAASIMATLFQLAQANAIGKQIILVVDEVSIVQNPVLSSILSEARKFGMNIILSQQYLGQVDAELKNAIFANIYNYICFKVSDDDSKLLANNVTFDIPAEVVLRAKQYGLSTDELRRSYLTSQNTRECMIRLYSRGIFYPIIKARTIDINQGDTQ
jgi:Helicase HerA, central domain